MLPLEKKCWLRSCWRSSPPPQTEWSGSTVRVNVNCFHFSEIFFSIQFSDKSFCSYDAALQIHQPPPQKKPAASSTSLVVVLVTGVYIERKFGKSVKRLELPFVSKREEGNSLRSGELVKWFLHTLSAQSDHC